MYIWSMRAVEVSRLEETGRRKMICEGYLCNVWSFKSVGCSCSGENEFWLENAKTFKVELAVVFREKNTFLLM